MPNQTLEGAFPRFKDYINGRVLLLQEHLGLNEWNGEVLDASKELAKTSTVAYINIDYKYLSYKLHLDMKYLLRQVAAGNYKKVTHYIIHELCHIFVDRLYLFAIDAATTSTQDFLEEYREQAVQRVTKVGMIGLEHRQYVGVDFRF